MVDGGRLKILSFGMSHFFLAKLGGNISFFSRIGLINTMTALSSSLRCSFRSHLNYAPLFSTPCLPIYETGSLFCRNVFLGLIAFFIAHISTLHAQEVDSLTLDSTGEVQEFKYSVWSAELQALYFDLAGTGRENFGIHSAAMIAGVSKSSVWGRYIARMSFGFIGGPEDSTTFEGTDVFLKGLHFELGVATSLMKTGFRSDDGSVVLGIQASFAYDDLKGSSGRIKTSREDKITTTLSDQQLEFSLLTNWVGFTLGSWKPERPDNNKIENLLTRIEGWSLSLEYGIPIITSYRAMYTIQRVDDRDTFPAQSTREKFSGGLTGGLVRLALRVDLGG